MSTIYAVTACGIHHQTIIYATLMNRLCGCVFPLGWAVAIRWCQKGSGLGLGQGLSARAVAIRCAVLSPRILSQFSF
jgi:hypothetical protein